MKLLLCILVFSTIISCGKKSEITSIPEIIQQTTLTNSPIPLVRQTESCDVVNVLSHNFNFDLHLFLNGVSTRHEGDFTKLIRGQALEDSKVIKLTVYGGKFEVLLNQQSQVVLAPSKELSLCSDGSDYEENTYESAGLNTAYFIHKTYDRYTSAVPEVKIGPITLAIAPLIIHSLIYRNPQGILVKDSRYVTDNAYYRTDTKSVTFLPQSQEMRRSGMTAKFWEVPIVASHEYAHHIFQALFGPVSGSAVDVHGCFGTEEFGMTAFGENGPRKITAIDVLNAYNEGFADLVAYYSLSADERNVRGIQCLELSRDVSSPSLFNGKPKIFSPEALWTYFSNGQFVLVSSCMDPGYHENHTFGSIFAHATDRLMNSLLTNEDQKLVILTKWVKYLKTVSLKLQGEEYFKTTFSTLIRMLVMDLRGSFDKEICNDIKDIYPNLALNECMSLPSRVE
jgi:hypothetical protein